MADPGDTFEPDPRAGAEWGLASMFLGGVLVITCTLGLMLSHWVGQSGFRGWPRTERLVVGLGGAVAILALLAFAVAGLLFGVWAVALARRHRQPAALGLVGVMLNAFAAFEVLGGALSWYDTALRTL